MFKKIVLALACLGVLGLIGIACISAAPTLAYIGCCPDNAQTKTQMDTLAAPFRLDGTVRFNQVSQSGLVNLSTVPVDVVHVLDISGSMDYCINTTNSCGSTDPNQKLYMAKTAITHLNNAQQTSEGDRVGLATFPQTQSTSSYPYNCQQTGNYNLLMFGQNQADLTSDVGGVNSIVNGLSANSGTPLAGALLVARQMALDPTYHDAAHIPILIIASDGIANVRLNGQWTGFSGSTFSDLECNRPAIQDAIDQANLAKSDLNGDGKPDMLIYSVSIGSDFSNTSLQAIASEPTNRHAFTATDANSMAAIYNQITAQLQSEDCLVSQQAALAANASVTLQNPQTGVTLQTTTDANGNFSFKHLTLGTWQFANATVNQNGIAYNVFTDGIGGPVIPHPTIIIDGKSVKHVQDLALKTDQFYCSDQPTPAPTPTANPCPGVPDMPVLGTPADNVVVKRTHVPLRWNASQCATRYRIQVRQDSKSNPNWLHKSIPDNFLSVQDLVPDHAYYWRARACDNSKCSAWTGWWKFTVKP